MTLNGVMALILRYFTEFSSLGPITSKWSKIEIYSMRQSVAQRI